MNESEFLKSKNEKIEKIENQDIINLNQMDKTSNKYTEKIKKLKNKLIFNSKNQEKEIQNIINE